MIKFYVNINFLFLFLFFILGYQTLFATDQNNSIEFHQAPFQDFFVSNHVCMQNSGILRIEIFGETASAIYNQINFSVKPENVSITKIGSITMKKITSSNHAFILRCTQDLSRSQIQEAQPEDYICSMELNNRLIPIRTFSYQNKIEVRILQNKELTSIFNKFIFQARHQFYLSARNYCSTSMIQSNFSSCIIDFKGKLKQNCS